MTEPPANTISYIEYVVLLLLLLLSSRVCRNSTACSSFGNPDLITLVKRKRAPLNLYNLTAADWEGQWEKNTEANIIKRPKDSAEQCGCQDPRIVFDHSSGYFVMAFTAYGNGGAKVVPGAPAVCNIAFTRVMRSKTPEIEASWEYIPVVRTGTISHAQHTVQPCSHQVLGRTNRSASVVMAAACASLRGSARPARCPTAPSGISTAHRPPS
jgi:hypothetical protein